MPKLTLLTWNGPSDGRQCCCISQELKRLHRMQVYDTPSQMQVLNPRQGIPLTFMGVAQALLRQEGARALWAGLGARLAMMGPGAAVSWAVYERTKTWLASQ
jgi:acetyl-CoA carboxylase carboxyltransferase component